MLRLACSVASALATARCRYQPFAGSRVQPLHRKHVGAKSALRLLSNYDPLRWARSWFSCYNSGYLFCQRFPRRSKLCIACSDFLQKSERAHAAAPPFRKRSRSARLLGCKRPRDGSLSLPTFCGFEGSNPSDKNENISFCRLLTRRRGLRIVRDDVFFFKANAVSHSLRRSSSPRKASGFVGTPNTGYASLAATFL